VAGSDKPSPFNFRPEGLTEKENNARLKKKYKKNPKMAISTNSIGIMDVKFSHKMKIPDDFKQPDHNVLRFTLVNRLHGEVIGKYLH
jgi:hypothetical protein